MDVFIEYWDVIINNNGYNKNDYFDFKDGINFFC